jgi:uncharacterized protein YxjI
MSDLLSANTLVISQKAKLIELNNEYKMLDEQGNQVGVIREEGQSKAKKLLRAFSNLDSLMTHRLAMYDANDQKVLEFVRPRTMWKSSIEVTDGTGRAVGKMGQQNMFGKRRFTMESTSGQALGSINAENWRAWDFAIQDATGSEVGRITKKWAGAMKELFTTADNYMLQISAPVSPELRVMMLASAAAVDVALKQAEG